MRLRDRWVTEAVRETETEARTAAARFMTDPRCGGVRILRNFHVTRTLARETEIFQELRDITDAKPARINDIDEALPVCSTDREFTGYDSRHTMGRLFRRYLGSITATPTEIIHSYRELVRLQDAGRLVRSGVDHVADLQAAKTGRDRGTRKEELSHCIDAITQRAHEVTGYRLPSLAGSLGELLDALRAGFPSDDAEYLATTILARHLLDRRSWAGKLELLCGLIEIEQDPAATELPDGVMADVLGTDIIQDLLGLQPTLGAAICAMLDLSDGALTAAVTGALSCVIPLNAQLAEGRLPLSRRCLVERAHRQIRSARPLHPRDPSQELAEFRRLMPRLMSPSGLRCGPVSAEAITARFAHGMVQGGRPGRQAAVRAALEAMPDRATGVHYLCALTQCDGAEDLMEVLIDLMAPLSSLRSVGELAPVSLPPQELMRRVTGVFHAVAAARLPRDVQSATNGRIDELLELYVIANRIVENLDQPGLSLRDRAVRLVTFCGSGLLPPGRALDRAWAHSIALLRQPRFDERFIDGITDPKEAEAVLRAFHAMLRSRPDLWRRMA